MSRVRRLAGRMRRKAVRAIDRRRRRGPAAPVGNRRVRHLVVHASVPAGSTTRIGAAVAQEARTLAGNGVVVMSSARVRDLGKRGWEGVTATVDPGAFTSAVRAAVAAHKVVGPPRALVITTGRALGRRRLDLTEARLLRPDLERPLRQLVSAAGARRTTVVIELPSLEDLGHELIAAAVEAGDPPAPAPEPAAGLYEDLRRRVAAVPGVNRVVLLAGSRATPARFAAAVAEEIGPVSLPGRPRGVTTRWNLRSLLAAAAVNEHVTGSERAAVHTVLRTRAGARPFRPVTAALPPGAVHVAPRPDPIDLHLHIGLQKTATTTVQAALHQARGSLAGQGVAYIGRRYMMRLPDRSAWRAYPHTGKANLRRFGDALRATVEEHRRMGGGDPLATVLISNETIVGTMEKGPFLERPLRPRAEGSIADLLDILQPASCHLVLLTRRQDTLLESQYMWQVHGGASFPFDRYLASARRHPDSLSYLDLARRLEAIPGVDGLTVLPFETIRQGLDRFLNAVIAGTGATVTTTGLAFDRERNPAYSGRALEIALAVNPLLRGRREHRLVRDHLRAAFPVSTWGRVRLLDEGERHALLAALAPDNEALVRGWMPGLPVELYSGGDVDALIAGSQAFSNSPATGK